MSKYLQYDTENFKISQIKWDRELTAKTESMMALGNGYLGLRSVDEEVESFNKENLLVNGIFNQADDKMVSEIANLSDLIQTPIQINGCTFSLSEKDEYFKELDIKHGTLHRRVVAKRDGVKLELTFDRFVSQNDKNIYGQKITIKVLEGKDVNIKLFPRINGQTTNTGTQHFKEGEKRRTTFESVQYFEETNQSNRFVFHNLITKLFVNGKLQKGGNDDYIITMARRQVGFKINVDANASDEIVLEKLMSVNTTIDNSDALLSFDDVQKISDEYKEKLLSSTYEGLLENSNKEWVNLLNEVKTEIIGDSKDAAYDRLALAFGIFHTNSFVPRNNTNLAIGAKGLSGEGYQGHNFWDTEFFIMTNYLYTNPQIARNLLEYRYKGIEGARAKAKEQKERAEESNLEGAQYPWESAWPSDGEVCPYWGQADLETGKQEPVASRRQEIHVSADVAYAVHMYYTFTKDEQFMIDMGYEILIDTAIFWAHRAEKQKDGTFMIKDVMGPNEYKGNIDNNAYINMFAKKNLQLALDTIEKLNADAKGKAILKDVYAKIPYNVPVDLMKEVFEKLKQQEPNKDLIIAENDQFLDLPLIDVSPFQLRGDAGKLLFSTKEGHKRLCSQLVKQADVVLLTYLLPDEYSREVIEANFDYYEPITTHDSSLSPTTYVIQATELRKMEIAYKLYKYSINIDLGENMKSCDAGIHSGAIAAIWQSTVFGYGGLRWFNNQLHLSPILPKAWDGLNYNVSYQGSDLRVEIGKDNFSVVSTNNVDVTINVNGQSTLINGTKQTFEVIK